MSRSIMLQQLQALGNNCLTLKGGGCFLLKKKSVAKSHWKILIWKMQKIILSMQFSMRNVDKIIKDYRFFMSKKETFVLCEKNLAVGGKHIPFPLNGCPLIDWRSVSFTWLAIIINQLYRAPVAKLISATLPSNKFRRQSSRLGNDIFC